MNDPFKTFEEKLQSQDEEVKITMDLASMISNETQPIEIILIKYYETNSTVMGYHEYQKK